MTASNETARQIALIIARYVPQAVRPRMVQELLAVKGNQSAYSTILKVVDELEKLRAADGYERRASK